VDDAYYSVINTISLLKVIIFVASMLECANMVPTGKAYSSGYWHCQKQVASPSLRLPTEGLLVSSLIWPVVIVTFWDV